MRKNLQRILASLALCAVLAGSLTVPASAAGFQDVPSGHWAAKEIQRCVEKGFFNGQSATRFGLGEKMSRSAFAVVLCRFYGWETAAPETSTFSDVPADAWYAGAVEAAVRNGAVTNPRGVFRPNDPITREELAVMLVRALGYGDIAGMAQDLPMPFEDVKTNSGYIAMAYDLGLVSGTTATTFAPANTATREQVAVILMRLYDKLHGAKPDVIGVVSAESDIAGLDIVALPAVRAFALSMKINMDAGVAAELQAKARENGAKAFLYMEAGTGALNSNPEQMGPLIADEVKNGGYDGLILDIPGLNANKAAALNKLVRAVDQRLGSLPFYLVTEAPSRAGKVYDGYQYERLNAWVDRFVLRISDVEEVKETFVLAPIDSPEEIHYALASVEELVGKDKVVLMLETGMRSWTKSDGFSLSENGLKDLLAAETTKVYYSDRYECGYLIAADDLGKPVTAWFLTEDDVASRVRLAGSMGIGQICVSDWDAATEAFLAGVK